MRLDARVVIDEVLDRVRDLELATLGRLDGVDRLEDFRSEEIDPDQHQVGLRMLRLFLEPGQATVAQFRHAEPLGLADFRQQQQRVRLLTLELLDEGGDAVEDQVVAEVHDKCVSLQIRLRDLDGMR